MQPTRPAGDLKPEMESFRVHLDLKWPIMAWYATASPPAESIQPPAGRKTCIYERLTAVAAGASLCLSIGRSGCAGVAGYLGFRPVKAGTAWIGHRNPEGSPK